MKLNLRQDAQYDLISLGEVMLRLDPGEGRIKAARNFRVWEGGGEYNVARGLKKCFNKRTAILTALADNDVGKLIQDFIMQGGVDTQFIKWFPFDGIGKEIRNGLNFTERGYGIRGAKGVSDRGNSAASRLTTQDLDFDYIFGELGAKWLHTGGIFAALSNTTQEVVIQAVKTAKKYGTIVSYDLNYRPSLWKSNGGIAQAQKVNKEIAQYVDVMIGNEEDFTACLGFSVDNNDLNKELNTHSYKEMILKVSAVYPNLKAIGNTLREVKTATINNWSAILYNCKEFYQGITFNDLEIMDRVGGGDSFAAGLIYGILEGLTPKECVDLGVAHGALAMTTPGDTSMASLQEVQALITGKGARVDR